METFHAWSKAIPTFFFRLESNARPNIGLGGRSAWGGGGGDLTPPPPPPQKKKKLQ